MKIQDKLDLTSEALSLRPHFNLITAIEHWMFNPKANFSEELKIFSESLEKITHKLEGIREIIDNKIVEDNIAKEKKENE